MPRVADILHDRKLFSVSPEQTVAEVARQMAGLHVGAILVLHNGELLGVFSERDLMTRVVLMGRDPNTTPVSYVMSTDLATIEESATVEQAMQKMDVCKCRHLPVLRDERVVGFLSMRDLMHIELARKTEELAHMHAYIHGSA
jgi:signal-transduction protein with cAMP-binding, CBS, and nucleotidyltransferase domain